MRKTNMWKWMSYVVFACLLAMSVPTLGQAQRRNPEAGKKKAAKRIGIGAAVGGAAGGLIGGKKGALIGLGAGAGAGTAYHIHKKRYRRR